MQFNWEFGFGTHFWLELVLDNWPTWPKAVYNGARVYVEGPRVPSHKGVRGWGARSYGFGARGYGIGARGYGIRAEFSDTLSPKWTFVIGFSLDLGLGLGGQDLTMLHVMLHVIWLFCKLSVDWNQGCVQFPGFERDDPGREWGCMTLNRWTVKAMLVAGFLSKFCKRNIYGKSSNS